MSVLKSNKKAWVYVQSGINVDLTYLQNDAIKLELFQEHHIPILCEKAEDPKIWQYHRNNFHDPDIFVSMGIEKTKKDIAQKTRCMFVIYYNDKIIGSTSYYNISLEHLTMYIGYSWLQPEFWGKGINQAIKKLLLAYAFEQLKFKRIAFCIDCENLRSRKAVEKLDIPFEGVLKNHQIRPDGSSRDSAVYAITDLMWQDRTELILSM